MAEDERLEWMLNYLLGDDTSYHAFKGWDLYRGLVNMRRPKSLPEEFLQVQDDYLKSLDRDKIYLEDTEELGDGLYIFQGDISTLKLDGIVNAANSRLLGCMVPNHYCLDNTIHTFAGSRLRDRCFDIIERQGRLERTGSCKITSAYNLEAKYILHTVGPINHGQLGYKEEEKLRSCYRSCLDTAVDWGLDSLAFPCISTGQFAFPKRRAAEIAIESVKEYKKEKDPDIALVFTTYGNEDYQIYKELLSR